MLIATDLDRTLIFSEKFASQHPSDLELLGCENYRGANVSLIAATVRQALQEISVVATLVPTTTRTAAQYERLELGMRPPWVICCSGGVVLREHDGQLVADASWSAQVSAAMAAECAERRELHQVLSGYAGRPWLREVRDGGGIFFILIVDPALLPATELADLTHRGLLGNWRVVHQGGKVYVLPRVVTKAAAVEHVRRIITDESGVRPRLLAAGDSILDWDMICHSDAGWTSPDGELAVLGRSRPGVVRTLRGGVESSVDLIDAWRGELSVPAAPR